MSSNSISEPWDMIVVGAGTTGIPAAAMGAKRGGRVLLIDVAERIGGTLLVGFGQLSAAGTRLQAEKGIEDSPQQHLEEAIRISRGTIDPVLARLGILTPAKLLTG